MNVDLDMVELKIKIKKELFDMISGPNGVYLPNIKDCNYKFRQQLFSFVRKRYTCVQKK